jgi:excisionase family DNA binding protein
MRKRVRVEIQPVLLTPEDAAKCLSVGLNHTWDLIRAGKLVAKKDGRRVLIPMTEIKKYADSLPARVS